MITATLAPETRSSKEDLQETAARHRHEALRLIEGSGARIDSSQADLIGTFLAWWKSGSQALGAWGSADEAEYAELVALVSKRHEAHLAREYGVKHLTPTQRAFIYASTGTWARVPLFRLSHYEPKYRRLATFALGFAGLDTGA